MQKLLKRDKKIIRVNSKRYLGKIYLHISYHASDKCKNFMNFQMLIYPLGVVFGRSFFKETSSKQPQLLCFSIRVWVLGISNAGRNMLFLVFRMKKLNKGKNTCVPQNKVHFWGIFKVVTEDRLGGPRNSLEN